VNKIQIFKRILILTDGSKNSFNVADYGIQIGVQNNSELYCLYVIREDRIDKLHISQEKPIKDLQKVYTEEGERAILKIKKIAESYNKSIKTFIRNGKIVDEILKFIIEFQIDLICISHRIRSGSESIRLASVANQIIEFAKCPVFVLQHN